MCICICVLLIFVFSCVIVFVFTFVNLFICICICVSFEEVERRDALYALCICRPIDGQKAGEKTTRSCDIFSRYAFVEAPVISFVEAPWGCNHRLLHPSHSQSCIPDPASPPKSPKTSKAATSKLSRDQRAPGSGGLEGRGLACVEVGFCPTGGQRLEPPIARAGGILVSGGGQHS